MPMYYALATPELGGTLDWRLLPPAERHPLAGLTLSFCHLSLATLPRYLATVPWIDPSRWTVDLDAMRATAAFQALAAVPWLTGQRVAVLTATPGVVLDACPSGLALSFLIAIAAR